MRSLIIYLGLLTCFACSDDEQKPNGDNPPIEKTSILIFNEGNFGWGVATIDIYDIEAKTLSRDVFQNTNKKPIGNVLQSGIWHQGNYFFAVNNSNKIVVCDANLKIIKEISGIIAPRFIFPAGSNKLYVTNMYDQGIVVINTETLSREKTIHLKGWTEGGRLTSDGFWVCNKSNGSLYLIDIQGDKIKDSFSITAGLSFIEIANDGLAYVVGKELNQEKSFFSKVNLSEKLIIETIEFEGTHPRLAYISSQNQMIILGTKIYTFNTAQNSLMLQILFSKDKVNFYGLIIDEKSNEIYVSDVKDYVENSIIYRLNINGEVQDQFEAGVISNGGIIAN